MSHMLFDKALPLLVENFSETTRFMSPAFLVFYRDPIVRVSTHPWSISLLMDLSSAAEFIYEWDDLWFL